MIFLVIFAGVVTVGLIRMTFWFDNRNEDYAARLSVLAAFLTGLAFFGLLGLL